jgi:hypothetical protein
MEVIKCCRLSVYISEMPINNSISFLSWTWSEIEPSSNKKPLTLAINGPLNLLHFNTVPKWWITILNQIFCRLWNFGFHSQKNYEVM